MVSCLSQASCRAASRSFSRSTSDASLSLITFSRSHAKCAWSSLSFSTTWMRCSRSHAKCRASSRSRVKTSIAPSRSCSVACALSKSPRVATITFSRSFAHAIASSRALPSSEITLSRCETAALAVCKSLCDAFRSRASASLIKIRSLSLSREARSSAIAKLSAPRMRSSALCCDSHAFRLSSSSSRSAAFACSPARCSPCRSR
mmetsp:Transcript_4192/g.15384  ORF Transcript_4192/g.15384 Transcript_4192/m.15384 type:complete len:204 (+) Transcript_4192:185-796(+)